MATNKSIAVIRILIVAVCALCVLCSTSPDVATGGTSLGNGAVAGMVIKQDSTAASGAEIRLRPAFFRADTAKKAAENSHSRTIYAASDGSFKFDSIPPGSYVIEANLYDSLAVLARFIMTNAQEPVRLKPIAMRKLSKISGIIDMGGDAHKYPIYVFLKGIDRVITSDTSGKFSFEITPQDSSIHVEAVAFAVLGPIVAAYDTSVGENPVIIKDTFHVSEQYIADTMAVRALLDSNNLSMVGAKTVSAVSANRIVALNLESMGVSRITSSIGVLSELGEFSAKSNSLSSLPAQLANCTKLRRLLVNYNQFSSFPSVLWQLSSLTLLDLSHNEITAAVPDSIGKLTELDSLYLSFNYLPSISNSIGNCTALLVFGIDQNSLTSLPDSLGLCTNLAKLNANNNRLTSLPDNFCNLTSLKTLKLNINNINALPASFTQLASLEEFNIASNRLDDLVLSSVQQQTITFIDVKFNPLCSISAAMTSWLNTAQPGWDENRSCP